LESKYRLEIQLPGLPKTTNRKSSFGHWAQRKAEADKWKNMVDLACMGKRPQKPLKTARIAYIRHSSVEPDFDGLVSTFKHIQDGLILAGIIENDKPSNIGQPSFRWFREKPGKGFVEVLVEELEPDGVA
jgi:hypothetical protein